MSMSSKAFVPACLHFKNVSFMRGNSVLFQELSFRLKPKQILWIQGDNGIGKTSILRLAAGLSNPDHGQIEYWSEDNRSSPEKLISFQGHNDVLESSFSVQEELAFWADIFEPEQHIGIYLEKVGLKDRQHLKTKDLSAGQKRRLTLSRMLMSGRPIWLMDEPKAAMDQYGQILIDRLMQTHINNGGSILAATHNKAVRLGQNTRRLWLENVT